MSRLLTFNYDLGLPKLLKEWKGFFTTKFLAQDITAGITVAFIAVPLSLAIALASGVSPGTGLITAIIAGIVCALFGGTTLAVSGPAAAMSVLIADIVEKFGMQSLILICLLAGLMQLVSGMLGIGRFSRYVPIPVIAGFTAGIGFIILVGQLPRAFGLQPPDESHVFSVLMHIKEYFHEINGACLFIVVSTIVIIRVLPKITPKIPPILPAVAFSTLIVYFFNLTDIPLIGAIPNALPAPTFPNMASITSTDIIINAFTVYLLASLETLLSSNAIDKLAGDMKHDPNQELIGQGLGNIVVSLFGGMPVTSVIARSATNVKAGAKTRRASIIHSGIILLTVFAIAPIISLIPIAALAGVLLSVAFSMLNYKEFHQLWITSRAEGMIYAITFITIIFVDLIAGVQAGVAAAALILLWKASKTYTHISTTMYDGTMRLSVTGPLTFLSTGKIAEIELKIKQVKKGQTVILDLSSIKNLDTTGANAIIDLFKDCEQQNIKFYIRGLPRRFESIFNISGGDKLISDNSLIYEHDLRNTNDSSASRSARGRLIHGVQRFHVERKYNDKRLFEFISRRQDPHTLFITCSDSRIIPSLITSTDPGELFIMRNIGNFIPPYKPNAFSSEAAAIMFALGNFDITDIVVCGHANCGAIMACCAESDLSETPQLDDWIGQIREQIQPNAELTLKDAIKRNVLNQMDNLKSYPIVSERLQQKTLHLHAWVFEFDKSMVYEYNAEKLRFTSLVDKGAFA